MRWAVVMVMKDGRDPFEQTALRRLLLFLYLVPVFGMVPAAWTLTRRGRDRVHRQTSRLAIALGLLWGLSTLTLNAGATAMGGGEAISAELMVLLLNSVVTSGYFVLLLGLMVQVWRRRPVTLPGFSQVDKYMS